MTSTRSPNIPAPADLRRWPTPTANKVVDVYTPPAAEVSKVFDAGTHGMNTAVGRAPVCANQERRNGALDISDTLVAARRDWASGWVPKGARGRLDGAFSLGRIASRHLTE